MEGEDFEPILPIDREEFELDVETGAELVVEEEPDASVGPVLVRLGTLPVVRRLNAPSRLQIACFERPKRCIASRFLSLSTTQTRR